MHFYSVPYPPANFIRKDGYFGFFYVRYSTLLHLPPLRFHCVGGCWDRTRTVATTALAVGRSNHSAKSHPPRRDLIHSSANFILHAEVFTVRSGVVSTLTIDADRHHCRKRCYGSGSASSKPPGSGSVKNKNKINFFWHLEDHCRTEQDPDLLVRGTDPRIRSTGWKVSACPCWTHPWLVKEFLLWLTEESLADRERLSTSSDTEDRLHQENTFTFKLHATMWIMGVLVLWIQHFMSKWMQIQLWIQIQGFDDQKLSKFTTEKKKISLSKI